MSDKIIYVVTSGSYSDYSIEGVYDDEEIAGRLADQVNQYIIHSRDKFEVEEYILNEFVDKVKAGLTSFRVSMDRQGDSFINHRSYYKERSPSMILGKSSIPADSNKQFLRGYVWAKDTKHAAKIANEKRTQLIASGEWSP